LGGFQVPWGPAVSTLFSMTSSASSAPVSAGFVQCTVGLSAFQRFTLAALTPVVGAIALLVIPLYVCYLPRESGRDSGQRMWRLVQCPPTLTHCQSHVAGYDEASLVARDPRGRCGVRLCWCCASWYTPRYVWGRNAVGEYHRVAATRLMRCRCRLATGINGVPPHAKLHGRH